MPKLNDPTMTTGKIGGMQGFQFSATRIENLGSTEYTLVSIGVDVSGSVYGFEADLRGCLIAAVESCRKSPRSNNLLIRVFMFSTSLPNGIEEIHGFKPLDEIDSNSYPQIQPSGGTPLYSAVYSALGATNAYAKKLMSQDFLANGIVFIVTDGDDNCSQATLKMVKDEMIRGTKGEEIESLIGVLIGVNASFYATRLQEMEQTAGMRYIDAGDATKGKLAKIADFVSQSISSQSQSLGTGGPSQNIAATI